MIGKTNLKLVRQEKLTRPEIDTLKNQVAALQAQEPSDSLVADGSVTGATTAPQSFTYPIIAPWMDFALVDATNGSHFNDNTGSGTIPSGWTQTDAAQATQVNAPVGFWTLNGAAGETSWSFKKQTPFNIESLSASAWKSFIVGPLLLRDGLYTADVNYYFGVYRNNAGIDANTFVRININWLSASSLWQVRAERKDGTTQTNGTYYTLARSPVQPLWLRVALQFAANRPMAAYFNGTPFRPALDIPLMSANVGSVTWGQVWWQFSMSRGAGNDDRVMIGGIDYSSDT